ncbi:MAG: NAD(P)H-dependent oxidoreductase subunit E [Marinilabiliales bacterium]|nr:NAD(P)H-dependent oxidoreductase subunit E [Marinilabiliales bacterium]
MAGYDLTTGAELWRAKGLSAEIGPSVGTNSTMVFAGNEFAKLIGIKPGAGEEPVWQDNEFLPEVSSLVATEDHLFVATSFGAVACYDTKTGKVIWQHDFDYGFYASPIIAGGNVYLPDVAGVTQIFKASGTFEPVASPPLGEKTVSTPAFAHGKNIHEGSNTCTALAKTENIPNNHNCNCGGTGATDIRPAVEAIVAATGRGKDKVIPLLQAVQNEFNFIPSDALKLLYELTDITPEQVTGVSTFYSQFRHVPFGQHIIKICTGTACHVKGAELVADAFKRVLKLNGESHTTSDGLFSIENVACLGCCTLAPGRTDR